MHVDARVRYSRIMIQKSFSELLKEKDIDHISVTEICRGAGINRSTFYKHFKSPGDLLERLEQELLDRLQEKLGADTLPNSLSIIMNDMLEHKLYYQVLISVNGAHALSEKVSCLLYQEATASLRGALPSFSAKKIDWLYRFIFEGASGILKDWVLGGTVESVEEVSSYCLLLARGMVRSMIREYQNDDAQ